MPTLYKNNSRFSSKLKGCSPRLRRGFGGQALQLPCNLTGMKSAIGYYSYTIRYVVGNSGGR